MFKGVLFATSATPACDPAARVAFAIAGRHEAQLSLFHVLGVPSRGYSREVVDIRTGQKVEPDEDYLAWVREEIKVYYAEQLKGLSGVTIDVAVGYPHREILRWARTHAPDLIVMGGSTGEKDGSSYKKVVVGSTLHQVARAANCPVLAVARPAASFWGGFSSIVFATDFSRASDAAFMFAYQITRQVNGELHLFHALDIGDPHAGAMVDQDDIEKRIREARMRIRGRYVARMEDFKRYSMDVWEGIPFIEIVKYAREKQADLIVLAHHNRPEETDSARLSGNMEQVIVRANCPVISVSREFKTE